MAEEITGKIARKYLVHYINATPGGAATYEKIGKDLEEYNTEMNAELETKSNILGETSVNLSSYAPQASVEPYYAEKESPLSQFLQDIVDGRKVLDAAKTGVVEVHTWEGTDGAYTAYKESAIIEVVSYGGDTTGYQIPFNVHYLGDRVKGTFNPATKTFTPDAA